MWVMDFLESEWNEPVTLKKQLFVFDGVESYIFQAKFRILDNLVPSAWLHPGSSRLFCETGHDINGFPGVLCCYCIPLYF